MPRQYSAPPQPQSHSHSHTIAEQWNDPHLSFAWKRLCKLKNERGIDDWVGNTNTENILFFSKLKCKLSAAENAFSLIETNANAERNGGKWWNGKRKKNARSGHTNDDDGDDDGDDTTAKACNRALKWKRWKHGGSHRVEYSGRIRSNCSFPLPRRNYM